MRVLLLTARAVAPPYETADLALARLLLTAELDVAYSFAGDDDDPTPWPRHHRRARLNFGADPPGRLEKWRIAGWLMERRPRVDLVHAVVSGPPAGFSERMLLGLAPARQAPLVLTCTTAATPPRAALRRSRVAVAVTHRSARRMRELGHPDVRHIPAAVDLDAIRPQVPSVARDALELPNAPHLLFAGGYDPAGGLDAALETAAAVRSRVPSARLLLGLRRHPAQNPAVLSARLRERVLDLGLSGATTLLPGRTSLRSAVLAADAVLHQPDPASTGAEIPPLLVEALALGRPLLVTDVEPLDDLADGGLGALAARPAAVDAVSHLARICADPDFAIQAGGAARALAEERHDGRRAAAAYEEAYRFVTAR